MCSSCLQKEHDTIAPQYNEVSRAHRHRSKCVSYMIITMPEGGAHSILNLWSLEWRIAHCNYSVNIWWMNGSWISQRQHEEGGTSYRTWLSGRAEHRLRILQAWDSIPRSKASEQTNTECVLVLDEVASELFETGWFRVLGTEQPLLTQTSASKPSSKPILFSIK